MPSATSPIRYLARAFFVCVIVLVLGGCVRGIAPYQPVQLGPGEAALYLYRPRSVLSPGPVRVYVDQHEFGALHRNTHAALVLQAGEHLVRVERRADATRRVLLGPGESLYLEVGAALLGGKVSLADPGRERALERIAQTRAVDQPIRINPN